MRSSERLLGACLTLAAWLVAPPARAQQQVGGFAVERFYPSAAGAGWFVMDDLSMQGTLGGAMGLTTGYASQPLRVTDGTQHLAVVSDQAFADFAFAVHHDVGPTSWRLSLDMPMPLLTQGQSGTVGGYAFSAPSVDPGSHPDTLSDVRVGLDARLLGCQEGPFRLGAGAQVWVPNGNRSDYDTDGDWRAMFRVLGAGDVGPVSWAAQVGVHVRPQLDSPAPGFPQGSELLFGAAAGARVPLLPARGTALVVGPEVFGETALSSPFGATSTGLEGLLGARLEQRTGRGALLRVRLGAGPGIVQHFGAPAWRAVLGVEISDRVRPAPPPSAAPPPPEPPPPVPPIPVAPIPVAPIPVAPSP